MKGDFSRDSFDPFNHFTRVLMQQGRVQTDADWNEHQGIIWHYLRTLAADIIGPHGGPAGTGFMIIDKNSAPAIKDLPASNLNAIANATDAQRVAADGDEEPDEADRAIGGNAVEGLIAPPVKIPPGDFIIGKGRYYVDGILCENDDHVFYSQQPDWRPGKLPEAPKKYLVYLEVRERHITYIEDDAIREVALGGADTATRAKIVWQVKTQEWTTNDDCKAINTGWAETVKKWQAENRGHLKARAKEPEETEEEEYADPCVISPYARYRGAENQLYRVEVHRGSDDKDGATFKWSRDNGSVLYAIADGKSDAKTATVTLVNFGRDDRFSLAPGDWVEVVYKTYELTDAPQPLLKVTAIDPVNNQATLAGIITADNRPLKGRALRRWDQKSGDPRRGGLKLENDGSAKIQADGKTWVNLEDGIQVQFQGDGGKFRSGDYWLIPARTATSDVVWPNDKGRPLPLPPAGVERHYAPLGLIVVGAGGEVELKDNECRRIIRTLTQTV
jgi:uncharacterized protein DUF6519